MLQIGICIARRLKTGLQLRCSIEDAWRPKVGASSLDVKPLTSNLDTQQSMASRQRRGGVGASATRATRAVRGVPCQGLAPQQLSFEANDVPGDCSNPRESVCASARVASCTAAGLRGRHLSRLASPSHPSLARQVCLRVGGVDWVLCFVFSFSDGSRAVVYPCTHAVVPPCVRACVSRRRARCLRALWRAEGGQQPGVAVAGRASCPPGAFSSRAPGSPLAPRLNRTGLPVSAQTASG